MQFNGWSKFLFFSILICFLFCFLSFSFAADDLDSSSLVSDCDDVVLSGSVDFDSLESGDGVGSGSLGDSPFVDDGDANNDEGDVCVENLEEDSHGELEPVSGFEPNINPGLDPMDNRISTKIVANSFSKYYLNNTQLVAYLRDVNDNPLVGKRVSISIHNHVYNRTTNEEGGFSLNINLFPNNYTCNISFAGDCDYKSCTKSIVVKVFTMPTSIVASNLVKYYRNASQLRVRLLDGNGNPLVGHNVTIKIASNTYKRLTDDDGYAVLNINLPPSVRNATLNFTEMGYKSSQKLVTVTVKVMPVTMFVSNLVKYYRNASQLRVRLLDGNGNPLVGHNVTIDIASATYKRLTDGDGYATLNINLPVSVRTAVVSFNEQYYYNSTKTVTVTVLIPPAPSVNWDSGYYNCSNLSLNCSAYHQEANVFCSFDNGSTWYNATGELCFILGTGNWSVLSYVNFDGFNSSMSSFSFVVDNLAPVVWASNGSAIYNESFYVDLYAVDDADINPSIYYTLDGSVPDENSTIYTEPIFIENSCNLTTLRFVAVDFIGQMSSVVNVFYFFGDLVANLNNGKIFDSVQKAIDDNDTFEGDIIEVSKDLSENVLLNKSVYLRACDFKDVLWESEDELSSIVFDSVVNTIVEGFVFRCNNNLRGVIVFDNASNCFVVDNIFFILGNSAIMDRLSVNDFYSYHGISFNNHILYNQFYGSTSCINLNYCINYTIIGNNFNKDNHSLFDLFEMDYNFGQFNWGIYAMNSFNSLFANNSFFNMGYEGICLFNSTDDTIVNNSFSGGNICVNIIGNNSFISKNNFTNNNMGISISGLNNSIISNLICENGIGIFSENSTNLSVNFNRIANNEQFGLSVLEGCVNATNNWWGSNNLSIGTDSGCDVNFVDNFDVIYEPYLVLNTYVSSFRRNQFQYTIYYTDEIIMNHSSSEAVCVADFRRNNFGEDVSYLGTVPNDSILFVQGTPTLHSHFVPLVSGLGTYFAPKNIGDGTVLVIFDNIYHTFNINEVCDETILYFNSTGIVLGNDSSFRNYIFNLNDNVDWVSFIWKYVGDFRTEFNIILDGDIVDNFTVESSFYHANMNNFSSDVWQAMELYNDFLYNKLSNQRAWVYVCIALDYGLNTFNSVENRYYNGNWRNYTIELKNNLTNGGILFNTTLLSLIKERYNLTDAEIDFVYDNHLKVRDFMGIGFAYLGNGPEVFKFQIGNSTEFYPFIGSSYVRYAEISCVNGAYAHMVGNNASYYEENWTNIHLQNGTVEWENGYSYGYYANAWYDGLMTFTFANDKVNDTVLSYWLNESNRTDVNGSLVFDVGPMKAAYGSFLEALLVIYMEDLVADAAAECYNVTWIRISPMVMSVHDNINRTRLTGECDFHFGREAYGSLDNVKAFYFACSASFSLIERYVGESLFPGNGDLSGVTTGLNYILEHNGTLEIFVQDGCVLIREEDNDDRVLIFDSETGLLHDVHYEFHGAFCYSNQQTDWAIFLGIELLQNKDSILLYLLGQYDLPNLSEPTENMVKSCKLFLGMGTLFVVEGVGLSSYLATLTTVCEGIIVSSSTVPIIIASAILVFAMDPVGEPDGFVDDYWDNYSANSYANPSNDDLVQIKNSDLIKEYKKIQKGEDIPINGDITYLNGAEGDPENLIKALTIISAFTGLLIVNDITSSYPKEYYVNNISNVTYYSNNTLQLNYTQSDSKITLTRV